MKGERERLREMGRCELWGGTKMSECGGSKRDEVLEGKEEGGKRKGRQRKGKEQRLGLERCEGKD